MYIYIYMDFFYQFHATKGVNTAIKPTRDFL